MDMIITFHGFSKQRVIELMPKLVEILSLGHPRYSVKVEEEPLLVFDEKGERVLPDLLKGEQDLGIVISVPGFDKIREDLEKTVGALREVFGVPVTTDSAVPRVVALDGNIY